MVFVWIVVLFSLISLVGYLIEGNRFLFLLLGRVVSSNKTYKWYAQVFSMKGAEFFFLQLKCKLLAVIKLGVSKCQNSPPCYRYVVKMAMLRSMLTSDHSGVCFYLYFVATRSLFDRGQWYNWSRVMANYSGNFVIALIFKLGYPGKLLWKSSVILMLVTWVETGVVCKLLDKRLRQGITLWSKLILQVIGNNEARAVKELFDQLHHSSSYNFGDSLILHLGNGSRNLIYIHVFARQYAGELQILSKRHNCKLVFLSLRASKLCGVSLQRGIELCLLPLCLWCIASVEAFNWIFTWLPEGPKYTVDGSYEYCSGRNAFLVEGVKIKELLVMVDGGVCFYGYMRWKFRLVPPDIRSLRSVKMKVQFSVNFDANWTTHSKSFWVVSVYIEVLWSNGEDYIREHGIPNASEWLRRSAGTHRNENSAMIGFLYCNQLLSLVYPPTKGCIQLEFLRGLKSTQFGIMMFIDPTVLMLGISLRWKPEENSGTNLHYVLMSIPSQGGDVNESASRFNLTRAVTFMFLIVFNFVLRLQTEVLQVDMYVLISTCSCGAAV
ncbi:uncharacterized protein LOC113322742 [Papaver somniferum]|uniref:uncharacterized protein LOC113322742 n=1 Tax=Papaver somniferum TaxID=3469 RepID=UPI000E704A06|nr:uncharacterized protein LOC113322742 [Papaver somniferum]